MHDIHQDSFSRLSQQALFLSGPEGRLEALTTWPPIESCQAVVIVCHPHPLYHGTMYNKVVTTLAKSFERLGFATVRFNYRGVGQSAGEYGHMTGEIADLMAVKAWVERVLPGMPIALAGFSFGSYIAASVANQCPEVLELVTVAPAVNHADFSQLTAIQCPWRLIMGEADEVVPYEEVRAFADHPPSPLDFISLPATSHFFHGRLVELQAAVMQGRN